MQDCISIIFAYRNRDISRVRASLESLQKQTYKGFKVVFVDYGSRLENSKEIKMLVEAYSFANYYYIAHTGLLWNKSKALNFGIKASQSEYVFLADVDVIFNPVFLEKLQTLRQTNRFSLFKIGYLSKHISQQQIHQFDFKNITTSHIGNTFGIGLFPKSKLFEVRGLDEFFHFYSSEDEDLNSRLKAIGVNTHVEETLMMYHLWHPRYPKKKDSVLTLEPRLSDVMRINQYHYLYNKRLSISNPNNKAWGECYFNTDLNELGHPQSTILLDNQKAAVLHFLNEELPCMHNTTVKVIFSESEYYNSLKYKVKKVLGKQTLPYLSLKEINDLILKIIVFRYRDYNYSYSVSKDLKTIHFCINLNKNN